MCAHLLQHEDHKKKHSWLVTQFERGFDAMVKGYDWALKIVLDHQRTTLLVTLATVGFTVLLALIIPKGFFPQQDTGLIVGVTEAAPDVSFIHMGDLQQAAAQVVMADPDVTSVASFIGADGTNATTNSGRLSITLKPREDRKSSSEEIIARLKPKLADVAGLSVYLQSAQDLQIDNRLSRTQFQYVIEDADPDELAEWGPKILEAMRKLPELSDVASDQQAEAPTLALRIDRDSAARLAVSTQAIDDTLYDAFGQRQISTIFTQLNLYRVILEVAPKYRDDPEALDKLYVKSLTGGAVPLSAVVKRVPAYAQLAIGHQGQFPAATLSFNVAPGSALGSATQAIQQAQDELGVPAGVRGEFQGAAQAFGVALNSEPLLILAALIVVYIVLGVLYESYIHPITILSTLPSAGVGALLALILVRSELSVIALIGIVLLIGIVKKNAIMMIDFALEAERDQHMKPRDAIYQACLLRFRPIMMTTMAALLGGLPLALGSGTGSELRRPLGITIVGGLLLSQMLTLFTTPVIYLAMDRLARWMKREKAPQPREAEAR
jgi:multidrug efflux pump subunit AcrB